ncbi:MAG: DUF2339 domain-containing protein, partial [Mesorhizobium sp.]
MFFSLIAIAAVIALFVIVSRQQNRIALVERELGILRGLVQSGASLSAPKADIAKEGLPEEAKAVAAPVAPLADGTTVAEELVAKPEAAEGEAVAGPWTKARPATAQSAEPSEPKQSQPVAEAPATGSAVSA